MVCYVWCVFLFRESYTLIEFWWLICQDYQGTYFWILYFYHWSLEKFDCAVSFSTQARGINVKKVPYGHAYNSFKYLLLENELARLKGYNQMWKEKTGIWATQDPNAVMHLGDNPSHPCWSLSGRWPTFRKSMGLLWHAQSETIILPKELLCIMGWPLYRNMSLAAGILYPIDFPDLARGKRYAGNGIHVPTFGMFLFSALACVRSCGNGAAAASA